MSIDIAAARNTLVRNFLRTSGEWLWFIDDDMVFDDDILMRLLRTGAAIVQPLVLMRVPPHSPVMYEGPMANGLFKQLYLEPGTKGLVPVDACGTGGTLIRRHVFETIPDPWFEVGKISTESLGEDLIFCKKAKKAGLQIHVDTDTRCGHLTPIELWPHHDPSVIGNPWMTEVRFTGSRSLLIDAANSPETHV